MSTDFTALKEEVCAANLALVAQGLVKLTWGNVSALDASGVFMAIKPSGVAYEGMSARDMVVVEVASGRIAEGSYRPSSDAPTHLELYREWAGVGVRAIVHTHSTFATAFAQLCRQIECLGTTHADHFHGPVPLTRHLSEEEVRGDYEVNTGRVIIERFAQLEPMHNPAVLVSGHGPFAWGENARKAVENAVALEEVARMAQLMAAMERDLPFLPDYIVDKHFSRKHGPGAYYGQK